MFLYGKNSVIERLKKNPRTIKTILFEDNFAEGYIEKLIRAQKIPSQRISKERLSKILRTQHTQGIIAEVENFIYTDFDELLNEQNDSKRVLVFLDRVYDPQNLGAILRSAACFGGFAIIIPKYKACGITETVLHVAQGAENYISVAMVSNISGAIINAKKSGYWIMGAVLDKCAKSLSSIDMPFPLGIVLGSEGEGVRYGVDKHIDIKATIPMGEASLSYNVSIACAIFCYEVNKQKK
ncbi:MAG: 23S rRNA (guanosine(2251)-2'-O)-methyltransferase RlmB [Candidatus Omnitrophota bacterium]|jgi:23S rRNA (guanosine2251-2'-O)-methyltransferase